MWIFGYGSLIWKVDFPYKQKLIGYIKGYERKFWQASIDHRGTPEKPGRVVTLVPSPDPEVRTWGAAYMLDDNNLDDTLKHLDHREVMGYEKVPVIFHAIPNHPLNQTEQRDNSLEAFEVTMYYGSRENEHYVGETPMNILTYRIWESVGPSGANKEYLFNLCNAMREIKDLLPENCTVVRKENIVDSHLVELEMAVKKLDAAESESQMQSRL